tara:strand:- start:539 stop:1498 length:960 start_codon:yes stop_codon:yes gene_type:complete
MKKYNILITGGLGLVGFNLFNYLTKKNYNVYCLDKNRKIYKKLNLKRNKKIILGDFQNFNLIKRIIKKNKIGVIFHAGATTQVLDGINYPLETYKNNIQGTINILEAIRKINKKIIFIFSSSDKAYGELKYKKYKEKDNLDAVFPYDLSKSSSDLICQSYSKVFGLKVGIIRCGNIFGKYDFNTNRLIPEALISILKNKNIVIRSNGKLIRDYLYIDDAINAYFLLMKKLLKNSDKLLIYNVGSKYNLSVIKVVNLLIKISKNNKIKMLIKNYSKKEINNQNLDYSKIVNELGWKQKNLLLESLRKTFDWYKQNIKLFE